MGLDAQFTNLSLFYALLPLTILQRSIIKTHTPLGVVFLINFDVNNYYSWQLIW